jgi:hypothetical protein
MRVMLVSDRYPPTRGGVPLVTQSLALDPARQGHRVSAVAPSPHGHAEQRDFGRVRIYQALRARLEELPHSCCHAPNPLWPWILGNQLCAMPRWIGNVGVEQHGHPIHRRVARHAEAQMPRTARPPPLAVAAIDVLADDDVEATEYTTAQCAPAWDGGDRMSSRKAYAYLVLVVYAVLIIYGSYVLVSHIFFPSQIRYSYPCLHPTTAPMICNQTTIDAQKQINEEDFAASNQRDEAIAISIVVISGVILATHVWFVRKASVTTQGRKFSWTRVYLYTVAFLTLFVMSYGLMSLGSQLVKHLYPLGDAPNYQYPCLTRQSAPVPCDQSAFAAQKIYDLHAHERSQQSGEMLFIIVETIVIPIWLFHWWLIGRSERPGPHLR